MHCLPSKQKSDHWGRGWGVGLNLAEAKVEVTWILRLHMGEDLVHNKFLVNECKEVWVGPIRSKPCYQNLLHRLLIASGGSWK